MKHFSFALMTALASFSAHAEAGAAAPAQSPIAGFLPIILIIAVFYLLIIRPQSKKLKEHRAMIDAIEKGDSIVTAGGVHGKVLKVADDGTLKVEIASGVEITVEQSTVSQVKNKKNAPAKPANDNK